MSQSKEITLIGTILAPHGKFGNMLVGDIPDYVVGLKKGSPVFIGYSASFAKPFTVRETTDDDMGFVLSVEGFSAPKDALALKEMGVFAELPDVLKRKTGKYNVDDILGARALNFETREELGKITDVWFMPANDVWVIQNGEKEIPVPFVRDIIRKVDTERKIVEVFVIPGLLEIADEAERDD